MCYGSPVWLWAVEADTIVFQETILVWLTPLGVPWELKEICLAHKNTLPESVRRYQDQASLDCWAGEVPGRSHSVDMAAIAWLKLSGRERVFPLGMHLFVLPSSKPRWQSLQANCGESPLGSRLSRSAHLCSWVTYVHIRSELDKKALPLETQLPNLGPVKSIDFRETLRKGKHPWARPCTQGTQESQAEGWGSGQSLRGKLLMDDSQTLVYWMPGMLTLLFLTNYRIWHLDPPHLLSCGEGIGQGSEKKRNKMQPWQPPHQ